MPLHRVQRRYVGPLYTMPAMKQHEHHVDTVIRKLVTRLTAAFAGQVVVLDDWIHFYILGKSSIDRKVKTRGLTFRLTPC